MKQTILALCVVLAGCGAQRSTDAARLAQAPHRSFATPLNPGETPQVRLLVNKWADHYDVPRSLVHRVIQRESDYRADARNGPYYGMMQILPETARGIGFQGPSSALLKADTNLKWAVKYLRGAWLLADGSEKRAVQHYARGYYYVARNRCMLVETGLRATEVRSVCG